MENGKSDEQDQEMEEANLEIAQLQALVVELRTGLQGVLQDVSALQQRDRGLEERAQGQQSDVDDRIMGIRNSLNTFKEDLSGALSQIKEVTSRQKELQKGLELLQSETGREILSVQQRKSSKGDCIGEGHGCLSNQTELNVIQHYFASLPSGSPQMSTASTQTSNSEQDAASGQPQRGQSKSPVWRERKESRDDTDAQSVPENSKRQVAALELLESERVYVSYLSLLLKANITFNSSEALHTKDKRPFPSSLRFLIQQHLELLHTLQERVLKCQWQGIMGDVFMRLTSKESDFLDFYVSYLKELPECLSVVSMLTTTSLKAAGLFEGDIMGDETQPSLHTLLLQPVQRIPEYLLLLQTLLKQTDAEHPDYYLLLLCIQQFSAFTAQYAHLLQHNQELLLHNRKELKRSTMKQFFKNVDCGNVMQANEMGSPYPSSNAILLPLSPHREHANQVKCSKQRLLEQIQSRRFQDWESEAHHSDSAIPFFSPDTDPRLKPPGLQSIPEMGSSERLPGKRLPPGSAMANALGEFLLPGDAPGLEGLYEDTNSSLHNMSMFDQCSSTSSDSSIDIAFVRYPKSHQAIREVYNSGGSRESGYKQLPGRGCVSPEEAGMMRVHHHRPLQADQRKSKSLNGLQLDSTVSGDSGPGHLSDHLRGNGAQQHAKLERQSSNKYHPRSSKGQSSNNSPISPPQHRAEPERQIAATEEELHNHHNKDSGSLPWGEEPRWKAEGNNHTPFSERSRKQEKGGFRSSFKKLFKKKSGGGEKDKDKDKTECQNSSEQEAGNTPGVAHLGIDRGTAV
ncbi:rho guanine nucleotide exchange factor 33 isoform X3 [Salmo salar]|uniref:Rho guanine nucleotide exchange factor 33 isoform X3 n=1 Tax=Salmo salar TaxID=8030 RepID=A0A1S3N4W8_SALSA|nr:rho guanine nucleotide exchange factor 33 isoform X3 [Salmo salar]|eukprot:XP_014010432.1 PREDICTED: rho guanine nucleotide exchange factor 33-like isoform X3 [Salmo salar]